MLDGRQDINHRFADYVNFGPAEQALRLPVPQQDRTGGISHDDGSRERIHHAAISEPARQPIRAAPRVNHSVIVLMPAWMACCNRYGAPHVGSGSNARVPTAPTATGSPAHNSLTTLITT